MRTIKQIIKGKQMKEGNGVVITRLLGHETVEAFDPFLMLDVFDAQTMEEGVGFPTHPHRGIEAISYILKGGFRHRDSLGNVGEVSDGGVQWLVAGSGIYHEETPLTTGHLKGLQLWINLPKKQKMIDPSYQNLPKEMLPIINIDGGLVKVIAGEYQGVQGHGTHYVSPTYLDIQLNQDTKFSLETKQDTAFIYVVDGSLSINHQVVQKGEVALLTDGDEVLFETQTGVQFLFLSGNKTNDDVVWAGPIVMNTEKEIREAFQALNLGTFTKHKPLIK